MDGGHLHLANDGSLHHVQDRPTATSPFPSYLPEQSIEYHEPSSSHQEMAGNGAVSAQETSVDGLAHSSPFSRHLGRNRACASCRDRKLKCDGARPICGQCSRAWSTRKRSLKAKGVHESELHQLEQPCSYLELQQKKQRARGARGGAKAKQTPLTPIEQAERERKKLEGEVAELKARLHMQNAGKQHEEGRESSTSRLDGGAQSYPNSDELSIAEILATTMRSGESFTNPEPADGKQFDPFVGSLTGTSDASQMARLASASLNAAQMYPHSSTPVAQGPKEPIDPLLLNPPVDSYKSGETPTSVRLDGDSLLSNVIFFGWPSDFPTPALVDQLSRVFFDQCDYLRCLFQPSRFFEQLAHGPNSPHFPHLAILHGIFSFSYALRPDLDPINTANLGAPAGRLQSNDASTMVSSKYHYERAKHHVQKVTGRDRDLLSACKAVLILANIKWCYGDILEAWVDSGMAVKMAVACSLNQSQAKGQPVSGKPPAELFSGSVLPPAGSWVEEEERRRVMFLVLATDQGGAASMGWQGSMKDEDVKVELPMFTTYEFQTALLSNVSSRLSETLQSPNLFSEHRYDSFNLMIKGIALIGRCGDFISHLPRDSTVDQVKVDRWHRLNQLITTFSSSLPFGGIAVDEAGERFDHGRMLVHLSIPACTLQLHSPLLRVEKGSYRECRQACTQVVNILRLLSASGAEVTALSPIFCFCLFITGRVLITLLDMACNPDTLWTAQVFNPGCQSIAHFQPPLHAQNGRLSDLASGGPTGSELEKQLQNDIDVIFIFMCKYGRIWPIAREQAQAMAAQLGVKVNSPELLRHGIFTDRNRGNHI